MKWILHNFARYQAAYYVHANMEISNTECDATFEVYFAQDNKPYFKVSERRSLRFVLWYQVRRRNSDGDKVRNVCDDGIEYYWGSLMKSSHKYEYQIRNDKRCAELIPSLFGKPLTPTDWHRKDSFDYLSKLSQKLDSGVKPEYTFTIISDAQTRISKRKRYSIMRIEFRIDYKIDNVGIDGKVCTLTKWACQAGFHFH